MFKFEKYSQIYDERVGYFFENVFFILYMFDLFQSYYIRQTKYFHGSVLIRVTIFT